MTLHRTCARLRTISPLIALVLSLCGCAGIFPGFEGPLALGSWTHHIPVRTVATQVQCELREFLQDNKDVLDPDQAATVSLTLQTDNTGYVQYVGIDLAKLGLTSLGQLIAAQKDTPSLQAKIQGKSTVSAQVAFSVPQTLDNRPIKAQWVPNPDVPGGFKQIPASTIKGLNLIRECPTGIDDFVHRLYLKSWFERFLQNVQDQQGSTELACVNTITLKTQFALILDASAGVNPLPGTTFILPVSGLNGDYSPAFTHALQITFALNKDKAHGLCTKAPGAQPARQIGL